MQYLEAIATVGKPSILIWMLVGVILGVVLGALPGLNSGLALVVLLPMTYSMDKYMAFSTIMAIYIGGISGGFIGSILLGIPGTASSLATTFDGYPMTKKGEAGRALSAGLVSNFVGTVPSIVVAMLACSVISRVAVKMGPYEYFSLCLMAVTLVASVSKGKMLKGIMSAGLGLLLYCVGAAPVSGTYRFTFGNSFLTGGFKIIPVMTGMMAFTMIALDFARGNKGSTGIGEKVGRFKWPGKDLRNNIGNIVRSFFMGLGIGFLPGLGGSLANIAAYTAEKTASKHPEEFGKGCVDGVIAPEVANNATVGGAIIPMISLGIPGDGPTVLLLAALTMQGLEPGPLLESNQPLLVKVIFISAIISALMILVIEATAMPLFPKILQVPYHYLYPTILVLSVLGTYVSNFNMLNVYVAIAFMAIGVWFTLADIPTSPFFLAFILGGNLESNFRKGMTYSQNGIITFFTRPVSCIFLLVTIVMLLLPAFRMIADKVREKKTAEKQK